MKTLDIKYLEEQSISLELVQMNRFSPALLQFYLTDRISQVVGETSHRSLISVSGHQLVSPLLKDCIIVIYVNIISRMHAKAALYVFIHYQYKPAIDGISPHGLQGLYYLIMGVIAQCTIGS